MYPWYFGIYGCHTLTFQTGNHRRLSDGLGGRTEPDEDGTGTLLGSSSVGDGRGGVWGADRDQHLASDQLHEGR